MPSPFAASGGKEVETRKLATYCADAETESAIARIRLGNISPCSTHTTGPQLNPKEEDEAVGCDEGEGRRPTGERRLQDRDDGRTDVDAAADHRDLEGVALDEAVDDCRDDLDEEHPPPRFDPEKSFAGNTSSSSRDEVRRQQGQEDAAHDRELRQGTGPPPKVRRCHLGDVRGCDDGRRADGEAADEAPKNESVDTAGTPSRPRTR